MKAKKNNLTIKQEGFAQDFVKFGDASKAYRLNYSASNMKDATVWKRANELSNNGAVKGRVEELKKQVEYDHGIDLKFMVDGYKTALEMALRKDDSKAFSSALDSLSKFLGNSKADEIKIKLLEQKSNEDRNDSLPIQINIDV